LFAQLAKEEYEAYHSELNEEQDPQTAIYVDRLRNCSFGRSDTPFENSSHPEKSVLFFYNEWCNFSSCKSFRWLDKWRLSEASRNRAQRALDALFILLTYLLGTKSLY
jgi:DnaJ family protein A protein 5